VLYAERVDGENIYDVFWSREVDGKVVVILADRGQRIEDPQTGELSFVLYNGTRHEGVPGALDFNVIEFAEHGIPVREAGRDGFQETVEMRSTAALLRSRDPLEQAELQWRFSSPISLLVLALLAVPLSRSSPREGRFARTGVGLLIYLTYANLISVARIWVERGLTPTWLGLWWVHVAIGMLALFLFARDAGWFTHPRPIVRSRAA
jgi:lipopolysaccharide export system permease protein